MSAGYDHYGQLFRPQSSVSELKRCASGAFDGDFAVDELTLADQRTIIVLIGSPTKGLVTSVAFVYEVQRGGELLLLAFRGRTEGMLRAFIEGRDLVLEAGLLQGKLRRVLVIPGDALVID